MLRFSRGIHTSRCLLQEAQVVAEGSTNSEFFTESKGKVDAFLRYWKNTRTMKLLMYRRKHSQELLARDLIDKHTDQRAKPLPPPQVPSKYHFATVIKNAQDASEIKAIQDDLALVTKKAHCTGPYLGNELLIKAAEFARAQNVMVFLYSSKLGRQMRDSSTLNLILTLLYLNTSKSYKNTISKVANAKKAIRGQENLVTDLLECAIYSKFNHHVVRQSLYDKVRTEKLELPLAEFDKSIGHQASLHRETEHLYLTLKPIVLELKGSKNFGELPNVKLVEEFVTKYEALTEKLGKPNRWDEIKAKSKFLGQQKEQTDSEAVEAETSEEVKEN